MTQRTRAEMATQITTLINDNVAGEITPADIRSVLGDMEDSVPWHDEVAATSHTHPASAISDSTATGRSVLTAADAGAARTAIGALSSADATEVTATKTTIVSGDQVIILDSEDSGAAKLMTRANFVAGLSGGSVALADVTDWPAAVSVTEVGYLDGVTSAIQTQLNGKAATSHTHTAANITDFSTAADARITASDKVSGTGVTDVVALTQTAYDALGTPDATTLYVITGA